MSAGGVTLALYLATAGFVLPEGERACTELDTSGRKKEAIICFEALLPASEGPTRSRIYQSLAWLHWKVGDYERALEDFRQCVAINRALGRRSNEGHNINFIGLLYQVTGQTDLALTHYQQALEIAREIDDRQLLGFVYYHLGWVNFVRGDKTAAISYYEQSLAIRRELGDRKSEAVTLLGLAMTHSSLSQYEKAYQYASTALPMIVETGDREREADARDHLGGVLTSLHRPNEAIEQHTRALEIRRALGVHQSLTMSLSGLARAYYALGRVEDAAAKMKEAVDVVEEGRRRVRTRRFRASMYASAHMHYERYISHLMELRDYEAAFTASERSRARLTLDSAQEVLELGDTPPLDAKQIQSDVLDSGSVIIEYSLGREKSFAWKVTRGAVHGYELPPREEIDSVTVRLHELLSKGDQRATKYEIRKLIARLSAMLIAPLDLPRAQRLVVVPDGALFYIPFAALEHRGQPLIEQYELTTAPSASALALLRRAAALHSHDAGVAVFADPVFRASDPRVRGKVAQAPALDPDLVRSASATGLRKLTRLPSTRTEAEAIARLAKGSRMALDFDASRATVSAENLRRYRVVHFATHALVNAQNPELSGIVLSLVDRSGAHVDGFLRTPDLFELDVQTDLVVLSACRTAMGKQLRGEGIVGLVSGFMHAGAPRVVASYWDVKDAATAELMKRFYRGMFARGLSPSAALTAAQRSMRREERFQSPYYWAAFSLYGLP